MADQSLKIEINLNNLKPLLRFIVDNIDFEMGIN